MAHIRDKSRSKRPSVRSSPSFSGRRVPLDTYQPGSLEDLEARIEAMEFRSLSVGLGLGDIKMQPNAALGRGQQAAQVAPSQPPQLLTMQPIPAAVFAPGLETRHAARRQPAAPDKTRFMRGFSRLVAALLVDSTVVALTLMVALTVAGWVMTRDAGLSAATGVAASFAPLKWLVALGPVAVAGVWAGVFVVYSLTMALVAGGTVGWSFCGMSQSRTYPQKNLVNKPNMSA